MPCGKCQAIERLFRYRSIRLLWRLFRYRSIRLFERLFRYRSIRLFGRLFRYRSIRRPVLCNRSRAKCTLCAGQIQSTKSQIQPN
nr:MAG TPA: hypothetical protein [Bacteriophage sp.]